MRPNYSAATNEAVYCKRGQMENLIKLLKAQLASDRTSCHSATANQVRLVLHAAAFWLMHTSASICRRAAPSVPCSVRSHLV
jgi:Transposase DDE domain group 1